MSFGLLRRLIMLQAAFRGHRVRRGMRETRESEEAAYAQEEQLLRMQSLKEHCLNATAERRDLLGAHEHLEAEAADIYDQRRRVSKSGLCMTCACGQCH
jgi:hypothetical protein